MKFQRKNKQTNKKLFLILIFLGLALICLGFTLYWTWNILTIPLGITLIVYGYIKYRRTRLIIEELEFKSDSLLIRFNNEIVKDISYNNLVYSLFVRKYYIPIRAIKIIEKNNSKLRRNKTIGKLDISRWDKNILPIAQILLKNDFQREKWHFGWSVGDVLIVIALSLGLITLVSDSGLDNVLSDTSQITGEVGGFFIDERVNLIKEVEKAESNFIIKNW